MPLSSRHETNFDHPDAFDVEFLLNHLESLRSGASIEEPVYDYVNHARKTETLRLDPLPVIIIEGILVLFDARMRRLMDLKIFVDCDPDIRFIRRLQRDIHERGRSVEAVIAQYMKTVRPMHQQFVQPSIHYADIILAEGGLDEKGVNLILDRIRAFLEASTGGR
jgi:uridine kinase